MSQHRQDTENGQLPLPTPRSPRELDERILAHARAKAPEKRTMHTAGWLGGLATTAVLVVAIYLTNTSDTNQGLTPPAPAVLKEERATSAAAASSASQPRAKLKDRADADNMQAAPAEQEELQMVPAAEMAPDSAGFQAMKRAADTAPNLQGTLEHLQQLLLRGEQARAYREYEELRNACSECGLPNTLEEALETLEQDGDRRP